MMALDRYKNNWGMVYCMYKFAKDLKESRMLVDEIINHIL